MEDLSDDHRLPNRAASRSGTAAMRFAVVAVAAIVLASLAAVLFGRADDDSTTGDVLRVIGPLAGVVLSVCGLGSLGFGGWALLRAGDRRPGVIVAAICGVLGVAFLMAELTLPH